MIGNIIGSFLGTLAFTILYNVPKRFYLTAGLTGVSGWLMYCMSAQYFSSAVSTFFGTMIVVLLARVFSVWKKCPITVFLISGIFPLVPGAGVYYTAYYFVTNELTMATQKGIESIKIAFAIVLGIVFILAIPRKWLARFEKGLLPGKLKGKLHQTQ